MQSDGRRVAVMLVLAGKRPTPRSSDSQTRTHKNAPSFSPQGSADRAGGVCVCVCVCVRACKADEGDSDLTLAK